MKLTSDTTVFHPAGLSYALEYVVKEFVDDLNGVVLGGCRARERAGEPSAPGIHVFLGNGPDGVADRAEAYTIVVDQDQVRITGSDELGTIFGMYHFLERWCDVDPLAYWTGYEPIRKSSLDLAESRLDSTPPAFLFRSFFICDEDLLTGWRMDVNGITEDVWQAIFSTILRLKGNAIIPMMLILPSEYQVHLAARRGLYIAQHHIQPLGFLGTHWDDSQEYSFTRNRAEFERVWRKCVAEFEPQERVLWTLNFRGKVDREFWKDDPSAPESDAERGRIISEAIAAQREIVLERFSETPQHFFTYLWSEGLRLVEQGHITLPEDVTVVWSDNGFGAMRGLHAPEVSALPDGRLPDRRHGVYYHLSFASWAGRTTQFVPPERVLEEFATIVDQKMTDLLMLNVSNIREFVLNIPLAMRIAWEGRDFLAGSDADSYYRWWTERYFGRRAAPEIVECYKTYFDLPFASDYSPVETVGENGLHHMCRLLAEAIMAGEYDGQWSGLYVRGRPLLDGVADLRVKAEERLPGYEDLWYRTEKAGTGLAPFRRRFFRDNLLSHVVIVGQSNRAFVHMCKAVQLASADNPGPALRELERAAVALEDVLQAMRDNEHGKWKNWYRGDVRSGARKTLDLARCAQQHVAIRYRERFPEDRHWFKQIARYQADERFLDAHGWGKPADR